MLELFLSIIDSADGKSKFEKIYNEYRGFMFKVAFSITQNYHDAEDAIQNVLFVIAQNIDRIDVDDEYKLKSFFRVIVRNSSIDLIRKREKERFSNIDDEEIEGFELYDEIEIRDTYNRILEKVRSLPDHYREVLVLNLIHNLTPKEISETLSIPINTVYTRLKRGKTILLEMIGSLYDKK